MGVSALVALGVEWLAKPRWCPRPLSAEERSMSPARWKSCIGANGRRVTSWVIRALRALERGECVNEGMVSLETVREHYGIWRWKIERESSKKFVETWAKINAASIGDDVKLDLADVAWALAAFERTYDVLSEDIIRAEAAHNVGVPPLMAVLTGPYKQSLDYLIVVSLWMDLADVLVSYRTIVDRFGHLKNAARRSKIAMPLSDIEHEIEVLEARKLPELSSKPIRKLGDTILHHSWHPRGARSLNLELYWKGTDIKTLDFADGDLRRSLDGLVTDTLEQVYGFILAVIQRHAG
jgi:hypothetical protein